MMREIKTAAEGKTAETVSAAESNAAEINTAERKRKENGAAERNVAERNATGTNGRAVEILPMKEDQLSFVNAIDEAVFPHSKWGMQSFLDNLQNSYDHCFCAVLEGQVMGFSLLRILGDAELLLIAVEESARGHGIGQKLMEAMMKTAEQEDAPQIFLEVRASNRRAISLYEKNGFTEIDRRKAYYKEPVEDAVIMAAPCAGC